jgi:hypothetical protein
LLILLKNDLPLASRITTEIAISLPLLAEAFLFYKGAKAEKAINEEQ